jgi:hypothetical protein
VHPIAEQARIAYATGWASSGGPMTDRVKAGCAAAIALACEHADDPGILEATLELGSLEGTWAAVYARRHLLYDTQQAAVTAAVRALLGGVDLAPAIAQFCAAAGIAEDDQDDNRRKAEALAAILGALLLTLADPNDPDYQTLLTTMINTLRAGQAEGVAGAIAIAAEQAGVTGIDFDKAFADAQAELVTADYLTAKATIWIKTIVEGAAADVTRTVTDLAELEATADDMVLAAEAVIDNGELPTVALWTDTAISQAFAEGALGLYTRLDVRLVDFMTAGDGRVCRRCTAAESEGPYPILEAPAPPVHPWCRCVQVPHNPLDAVIFASYAIGG